MRGGVEAEAHRDPELREHLRHRRVERGVDARDALAGLVQQPGQGGHGGAADGKQVELARFLHTP